MNNKREPLDLPTLSGMLTYISAEVSREEWVKLLMGIKSEFGEAGKDVAREWSATASNYSLNSFNATWKSIKAGGAVTIASLVLEAVNNGYQFAPMSKADKKRLIAEQKARDKQRKLEAEEEAVRREERYKAAKIRAEAMLQHAPHASSLHPYYFTKGISEDVKRLPGVYMNGTALMIPVMRFNEAFEPNEFNQYDHKRFFELSSVQFIEQDGTKLFLKGGQLKGGFYPVRFDGYIHEIVICEGYATAVTLAVHYAPLSEVVCAFNAGNLKHVARAFKNHYPTANIIIASDNDRSTELKTGVNVGIQKAVDACKAVDGELWIPEFKDHEEGTDWNDLYQLHKSNHKASEQIGGVNE